jgi:hypothetical protein
MAFKLFPSNTGLRVSRDMPANWQMENVPGQSLSRQDTGCGGLMAGSKCYRQADRSDWQDAGVYEFHFS